MSLDNMLKKLSVRSPWLFRINAGSCNGCDVELATTACIPRYDVERLGCRYCGTPRLVGARAPPPPPAMPTSCSSPAR